MYANKEGGGVLIMCTEDQRNRQYILDAQNLNKNLMIEAGAGSGKTTILVDRLIVQIKETDIKMSELVAITFTEKAAGVLKYRFQNKLIAAQKNEIDPVKKSRLTEALKNVEDIQISTIHSFCNKMLNECPFEANLGPGFGILKNQDEKDAKIRFVKEYAKVHKNDQGLVLLKKLGLNLLDFSSFFSNLVDEEYSEVEFENPNGTPKTYYDTAMDMAQKICDEIKAEWDDSGLSYEDLVAATSGEKPDLDVATRYAYDASVSKNPRELRFAIEKLKDKAEDVSKTMCALNDFYLSILLSMANEYQNAAKRNLTNQDLLNYACGLLRNSSKAREYLRNKYKFFYVDEYQDTDPVQTEIFLWLVAENDLVGKSLTEKINHATLLPGKICYIGDPKQSIYGFRRADITLYTKIKELIIKDDNSELVNLYANFRSNKEICSWVEDTFKNDFEGLRVETDKVLCGDQDLLSGVYYYRYQYTGRADSYYSFEAEHIAKMIKGMIDSGCKLYSADRKVEENDFMVLTPRKKKHINIVVTELKKYGLKVEVDGESTIKNSEEVANLFYILDFVNEPYSSLKFAKLIRFIAKEHYVPGEDYTEARKLILEQDNAIFEEELNKLQASVKVIELVKMLRELVLQRYTSKPFNLLQQVIENFGNLVSCGNYDDTKVGYVYGQLEQVLEQLRNKPIATLNCVCEELEKLIQNKEIDKELIVRNTTNAVKVMNVHKAKGLEGKIVILALGGAGLAKHQSRNLYCIETDNGNKIVSQPIGDRYGCVHSYSNSYKLYDKNKADAEKEEHKRILYVAATRAEEALIIPIPYGTLTDSELKGNTKLKSGKEYRNGFWGGLIGKTEEDNRVHNPEDIMAIIDARKQQEKLIQGRSPSADRMVEIRREVYPAYCEILNNNCKSYGFPSQIIQEPDSVITGVNISATNTQLVYRDDSTYKSMVAANMEVLGENQLGEISERLVSPSSCEEHKYHQTGSVEAGRMKGNLYGLILHKTYELLVNKIMLNKADGTRYIKENVDSIIEYILPLAIKEGLENESLNREHCKRMLIPEDAIDDVLEKIRSQQTEYLINHFREEVSTRVKDFLNDDEIIEDLLKEPETVAYTELPFTLYKTSENDEKVYVNGTMDLLIETKEKFIIWDYKSDGRQYLADTDELESIEDFEAAISKVYAPQLEMYTEAVRQMVSNDSQRKDKPIVTKLYHMYRMNTI